MTVSHLSAILNPPPIGYDVRYFYPVVLSFAFEVYLPNGYPYRTVTQYEDTRCGPRGPGGRQLQPAEGRLTI